MGDPTPSGKTFDFTLLPPRLQLTLWTLGLSADTSHVGIAFRPNQFLTSLNYDYGGAISASRGAFTLGFDPAKTEGSFVYKGYDFSATAKGSPTGGSLTLSYGKGVLPTPDALKSTFEQAWAGSARVWRDRGSLPNNPLHFLQTHSTDFGPVKQAATALQTIKAVDPNANNLAATITFFDAPTDTPTESGPKGLGVLIGVSGTF
jgi:hypothetical protein